MTVRMHEATSRAIAAELADLPSAADAPARRQPARWPALAATALVLAALVPAGRLALLGPLHGVRAGAAGSTATCDAALVQPFGCDEYRLVIEGKTAPGLRPGPAVGWFETVDGRTTFVVWFQDGEPLLRVPVRFGVLGASTVALPRSPLDAAGCGRQEPCLRSVYLDEFTHPVPVRLDEGRLHVVWTGGWTLWGSPVGSGPIPVELQTARETSPLLPSGPER